ncbi:MAG: hypothetical protein IPM59_11740 [Chloracidobacterium sp.]|nr:hypothetical protein [Chloracidobacterium sp.]
MRDDLDRVFSIKIARTVNRDNTVKYRNLVLQIDRQIWRSSLDVAASLYISTWTASSRSATGPGRSADIQPMENHLPEVSGSDGPLQETGAPFPATNTNRTFDVLTKPDIFICYQQGFLDRVVVYFE